MHTKRIGIIDSGLGGLYYTRLINKSCILIMDTAFFPYGGKSKEFLIKRTIYLCKYLENKCDKIILGCNTLSLIVLPFVKLIFKNISGVFDELIPYIDKRSIIIGSKLTTKLASKIYNIDFIDGSKLIYMIENNINYEDEINRINNLIKNYDKIILACTHFLALKNNSFCIKEIKNHPFG